MSHPDTRAYHRALTLYALHHAQGTCTSADLAEVMLALAQGDGQPKALWIEITPTSVAGHLRSLENDGEVMRAGERKNSRSGRSEPVWTCVGAREPMQLPNPAMFESTEEAPPAIPDTIANERSYAQLDRQQLYELLNVHDKVSGAVRRFLREIEEITDDARISLKAAGLDIPEKLG